jgi:hypothetical protein
MLPTIGPGLAKLARLINFKSSALVFSNDFTSRLPCPILKPIEKEVLGVANTFWANPSSEKMLR